MIQLKTKEEIAIMHEGGKILRKAVADLLPQINVGITTEEVDIEAERLIRAYGGESSFKRVPGYRWTTCLPINEQAVHTPPSKRKLQPGDVLTIDIGVYYQGFHTDYATTVVVGGGATPATEKFLKVGQETLDRAIEQAKVDQYLGAISKTVEDGIYSHGYFILKDLTGHGIGRELHEDPYVLNFLDRPIQSTYKIKAGLVIAVEIIYSMGTERIAYEKGNSWSIITHDRSLSACFEKTIAITEENTFTLT